jgi:hypothetical protein
MTDADYADKLDEIERMLNDPDVPMQPGRVWTLLAEIAERETPSDKPANKPEGRESQPSL